MAGNTPPNTHSHAHRRERGLTRTQARARAAAPAGGAAGAVATKQTRAALVCYRLRHPLGCVSGAPRALAAHPPPSWAGLARGPRDTGLKTFSRQRLGSACTTLSLVTASDVMISESK